MRLSSVFLLSCSDSTSTRNKHTTKKITHLHTTITRNQTEESEHRASPDLLPVREMNNASFLPSTRTRTRKHTHIPTRAQIQTRTEGHLIMSASVAAEKNSLPPRGGRKKAPRTATSPAASLRSLCHPRAFTQLLSKTKKSRRARVTSSTYVMCECVCVLFSLADYLFGAASVKSNSRSVRHSGSAAHSYRNVWTK